MLNSSTVQSKLMGISKETYKESQESINEQDFKYTTSLSLQNLKFSIDEMENKISRLIAQQGSDVKKCEIEIHNVMNSCMYSLKEFRESIDQHDKSIESILISQRNIINSFNEYTLKEDFSEKIAGVYECVKSLKIDREILRDEMISFVNRASNNHITSLERVKKEILSRPSEIPDMIHKVQQKLELAELNGQNAVLRSSNNENQLQLVERKIEQIYQMLKSITLKQEK